MSLSRTPAASSIPFEMGDIIRSTASCDRNGWRARVTFIDKVNGSFCYEAIRPRDGDGISGSVWPAGYCLFEVTRRTVATKSKRTR